MASTADTNTCSLPKKKTFSYLSVWCASSYAKSTHTALLWVSSAKIIIKSRNLDTYFNAWCVSALKKIREYFLFHQLFLVSVCFLGLFDNFDIAAFTLPLSMLLLNYSFKIFSASETDKKQLFQANIRNFVRFFIVLR